MNYGEDPMMDYGKDPYTEKPRRTSKAKSKEPKTDTKVPKEKEVLKEIRAIPDQMDVDPKGEESEEGEIAE
jgi:hypothetical protein